ncbi:DUF3866 family protein [Gelria sp. Kuro-4]|uniref:DUF3866 family protein n=1 Tax=Gelria sp. Kuro-4 TaxID=2796927 RepID=UPI001BEFE146|nr:DUF3866 family protein [Gelria sp. Kuro-4]BCV25318.1 hypothetical protein kuro4_20910 [Gelria sp. Kuro-4]
MVSLHRTWGRVVTECQLPSGVQELRVELGGREALALNYPELTGRAEAGSLVALNTTALDLGLGTGGYHFVTAVLNACPGCPAPGRSLAPGHIMKLRYTPCQVRCLAVEEEASPYHAILRDRDSIAGLPVVVAELHSMVAPAAAGAYSVLGSGARIVYIMTDGAALPLAFSRLIPPLKAKGLLTAVVTAGQAFGGDWEAVTIFSALLAARWALEADVAIVAMGPGIAGTGTRFGFSGVEQGQVVDAVNVLHGQAVAVPRLSAADPRPRHRGVSHHTLTALGRVAQTPATVVLPQSADAGFLEGVRQRLAAAGVAARHQLRYAAGEPGLELLAALGIPVTSMGRSPDEDPPFFLAAAAAGVVAGELAKPGGGARQPGA